MALKDWKKTTYHKNHIGYHKPYSYKRIEYYHFPSLKKYRLDITLKDGKDFQIFKTKTQALAYAKAYMRKH